MVIDRCERELDTRAATVTAEEALAQAVQVEARARVRAEAGNESLIERLRCTRRETRAEAARRHHENSNR